MGLTPSQRLSAYFMLLRGSSVAEVAQRLGGVPVSAVEAIQSAIRS
jgi:hypothetical protein